MRVLRPRHPLLAILGIALLVAVGLLFAQDQETLRVRTPLSAGHPRFPEYLSRLLGHPLTSGDAYVAYTDGVTAFPAMLEAVDKARHRISFESYIFESGAVGDRFVAAFERAARRGVEVRLILDAFGVALEGPDIERLEAAGCRIGWFNRVTGFSIEEANYRTHRKALIVDGELAFAGGLGIADQWAPGATEEPTWRDSHVSVRGPAAVNVEAAFNENWIETGGVVEPDLLPHDAWRAGTAQSIVVWSSPEGGANAMKLLYLLALGSARETLDIQSPYLITDTSTRWSLGEARRRGVRVRMLVEGDITDAKPVKYAGRAGYGTLMAMGIEIHEYQPSMMHTKALIIDGALSIVGSANFDNRSLELNDELNIAVFDPALAARLTRDFDDDLRRSVRLDPVAWARRPLHIRGREKLWGLFGELF